MSSARRILSGVWEFIVGDDWRTALGVVIALSLTAVVAAVGVAAWWVMPVAVPVILAASLRRAARGAVAAPPRCGRTPK